MENTFTLEDRKQIEADIGEKFRRVAISPDGRFKYPTGQAGLERQGYDAEILKALPQEVLASYCGVGNPLGPGAVGRGEFVLDIGCGAGVDTIIAAVMAGPEGGVVGIDFTAAMVARAKENLKKTALENVSFREGSAEDLQFPASHFDAVISNGVFNLVIDKMRALKEVYRVLKPGGRFMIADQVLTTESPGDVAGMIRSWAG
ncbi:MAG: methyltransferase domain-containing protein [Syntrophobacteraceae bacterium]|nr:methyltransferase domain-containing protein [Syntrophobacteraceae bacterium]